MAKFDVSEVEEMSEKSVWMKKYELSWLEWLGVNVLRQGRVPRHVAVIMDGNRRFARQVTSPFRAWLLRSASPELFLC